MNDTDVILSALQRERDDLHDKIMQVDRIIKRIKSGSYSNDVTDITPIPIKQPVIAATPLHNSDNMRVQLLRIMDIIGRACKLKAVQTEYNKLTGNKYNVREPMRTLQTAGLIHLVKEKRNDRGFMWVKKDWVENGRIKDEYKPDGFDMLYKPDDITFK